MKLLGDGHRTTAPRSGMRPDAGKPGGHSVRRWAATTAFVDVQAAGQPQQTRDANRDRCQAAPATSGRTFARISRSSPRGDDAQG
jgi:hypothetical protein